MTRFWISEHALTHGIFQADCKVLEDDPHYNASFSGGTVYRKEHCHTTKEAAIKKAYEMRDKRILFLQNMTFE